MVTITIIVIVAATLAVVCCIWCYLKCKRYCYASAEPSPLPLPYRASFQAPSTVVLEIPREPRLPQLTNAEITEAIVTLQSDLRDDPDIDSTVATVQKAILLRSARAYELSSASLIIGVDATPVMQAGYCVNLRKRTLQYYVIKKDDFPWFLRDTTDTAEFEMKNFIFALTLRHEDISRLKRIELYTDNNAAVRKKGKFGERASSVLNHLRRCEGITVVNWGNVWVNKFENLESFATFIRPADDMSRWRISKGVEFLTKFYGIGGENVEGTHAQAMDKRNRNPRKKAWYNPTPRYQQVLDKVRNEVAKFHITQAPCQDILTASLRRK